MIYYIMVTNQETGKQEFIEHYDTFSGELITTLAVSERQEYLSKESLLEEVNALLDNEEIMKNYTFTIGGY